MNKQKVWKDPHTKFLTVVVSLAFDCEVFTFYNF